MCVCAGSNEYLCVFSAGHSSPVHSLEECASPEFAIGLGFKCVLNYIHTT